MSDKKSTAVYRGKVVEYSYHLGYGTIEYDQGQVIFTYRNLPIKNGKYIIPKTGAIVEFSLEPDGFYGQIATNLKIVN